MSTHKGTDLDKLALEYWQDDLAKFFPTSKGPTNTEVLMFKAGWAAHEELTKAVEADK